MNRLLYILFATLTLAACHRPAVPEQQPIPADSLLLHVMEAMMDTNQSCMDVKEELLMFVDTMQMYVEKNPDEDIRIGVKGLALDFMGYFMSSSTPEETQFFFDTLVYRLADIMFTWYSPWLACNEDTVDGPKYMTLSTVFNNYGEKNHIIHMDTASLHGSQPFPAL